MKVPLRGTYDWQTAEVAVRFRRLGRVIRKERASLFHDLVAVYLGMLIGMGAMWLSR